MAFFLQRSILLAVAFPISAADTNLRGASLLSVAERVDPLLLQTLIAEVESALGHSLDKGPSARKYEEIEDMLRPTFVALPKNALGKLDHPAVRYALHRLFVQRHGWVIRGFQSDEEVSNTSSAAQVLDGKVPELVQEIFEKRIGEQGSSLHDIAVLAMLFEQLIHQETTVRLRDVYEVSNISVNASVDLETAKDIISMYMMFFIQGYTDIASFTPDQIKALTRHFSSIYPAWPDTLRMLDRVRTQYAPGIDQLQLDDISRLLNEAADAYYDDVHRSQCLNTKSMLLEMEDQQSGRVRLLDFYRSAIDKQRYQFTETITYLRHIGALDESDASTPKVIIPNYVSGQSNCVARTRYYAVCCPDACEEKLDQLENMLKKSEAPPAEILASLPDKKLVSALASRRLDAIALHHGGLVPLHGRLFAQWLHFVYPQACVYPHEKGTVYTKTMEEWEVETGQRSGSLVEEVLTWAKELGEQSEYSAGSRWDEGESGMWSMNEELVVERESRTIVQGADQEQDSSSKSSSSLLLKRWLLILGFSAGLTYLFFQGQWSKLVYRGYYEEHKYNV